MSKNPPAYTWYLPPAGKSDPEPRWKVMYSDGNGSFPVEVCAPTEETAIMRAGMKRAELTRFNLWDMPKPIYERLSIELLCDCPCHDIHEGVIPIENGKCGWCNHEVY